MARTHRFTCGYEPPKEPGAQPAYAEDLILVVAQIALIAAPPPGTSADDKGGWFGRIVMSAGYVIEGLWATHEAWTGLIAAVEAHP